MRLLVPALAVIGCARQRVMLVSDVRVEGYDLVIERCPVTSGDSGRSWDAWGSCETTRRRIPFVAPRRGSLPAVTPDREESFRRIGSARAELAACAEQQSLHGVVPVELVLGARGEVTDVVPSVLAGCVRTALDDAPFPVSMRVTRIAFSIIASDPAP